MDTKTLVVGQDVFMESGCYGCHGRVVKVTPSGVDVQTPEIVGGLPSMDAKLIHFDNNGCSYATESPSSCDPEDKRTWTRDVNGTLECDPWYIVSHPTPPYFLWNGRQHYFDCITSADAAQAGKRVSRVALVTEYDSHCTIYDSEGMAWGFHFVGRKEKFSMFDRLLAEVYNPRREFLVSYSQLRSYPFAELQRAYLDGVAHDDDILTQFVEAGELTKRITKCSTFGELLETWQWMMADSRPVPQRGQRNC